jgi:hypothetical protein
MHEGKEKYSLERINSMHWLGLTRWTAETIAFNVRYTVDREQLIPSGRSKQLALNESHCRI